MRQRTRDTSVLQLAGDAIKQFAFDVQSYFFLLYRVVRTSLTRPRYVRDFVQQMDTIGVQSLFIVLLTGLFTGMVLTVVLYRWIERRDQPASNVQENATPLHQGITR